MTAIYSLILGFIIAYMTVKVSTSVCAAFKAKNIPVKIWVKTFGLNHLVYRSAAVFTLIHFGLAYLILFPSTFLYFVLWAISAGLALAITVPLYILSLRNYIKSKPGLYDFVEDYRGTSRKYMELCYYLESTKSSSYKTMAESLWLELTSVNSRRTEALQRVKDLQILKGELTKLLNNYTLSENEDKKAATESKLSKVEKQINDAEEFAASVDRQIKNAESVFMDVKATLSLGGNDKQLSDLSKLTEKVKTLEYTVNAIDS